MGEANRRPQSRVVPDDVREDIAKIVHAVRFELPPGCGSCAFVNAVGVMVLDLCDLPAEFEYGGLVYRCGPDAMVDTVAWCGHGNVGRFIDGVFHGHIWVRSDRDWIDFSLPLWQREGASHTGLTLVDTMGGIPIPVATWTAPPLPKFFWGPIRKERERWRPSGTPTTLGEAWYCPFSGEITMPVDRHEMKELKPLLLKRVELAGIRERILYPV